MKWLLTLVVFSAALRAQITYNVSHAVTGSTASAVTVQQVANSNRILHFTTVYVECTVSCTVTIERNGSAATATEATPTPVNNVSPAAVSKAFTASDVGSGTALTPAYTVAANGSIVLDMSAVRLYEEATTDNVSVKVASGSSGNYKFLVQYEEQRKR